MEPTYYCQWLRLAGRWSNGCLAMRDAAVANYVATVPPYLALSVDAHIRIGAA
jgi:hypothetical protein